MLLSLSIQNFTLIDTILLQFSNGLSIITGETGAGKSIIFDAILYVLGERTSTEILKDKTNKTIVEISFTSNSSIQNLLDSLNFDSYPDTVILRRELSPKGITRCFVNDTPTTVAVLKTIGLQLVDFHGQFDHQSLLNKSNYFSLIDSISEEKILLEEYEKNYIEFQHGVEKLQTKESEIQKARELQDFYTLQLKELDQIHPLLGEIEDGEQLLSKLENAEDIFLRTSSISAKLNDNSNSVIPSLKTIEKEFEKLKKFDTTFEQYSIELQQAISILQEMNNFVQHYNRDVEYSEENVNILRTRLQELHKLRKKYGSLENAIEKRDFFQSQLNMSMNSEENLLFHREHLESIRSKLQASAFALFESRNILLKSIELSINNLLHRLGMIHSNFVCTQQYKTSENYQSEMYISDLNSNNLCSIHKNGLGSIDFLFSSNPGIDPKSLSSVASGGEISRVMLALKSIVADKDSIQLLIFDEIDVGISGSIAQKVGIVMKQLSQKKQIIAITHLPQIAALADTHFVVKKDTSKNQTSISIDKLKGKETYTEVARLLSGENITASSIQSAKELATIQLDF